MKEIMEERQMRAVTSERENWSRTEEYYNEEQKERMRAGRLSKIVKLGEGLRTNVTLGMSYAAGSALVSAAAINLGENQASGLVLCGGGIVLGGIAVYNLWAAFKKSLELQNMAAEDFEKTMKPRFMNVPKGLVAPNELTFEELRVKNRQSENMK